MRRKSLCANTIVACAMLAVTACGSASSGTGEPDTITIGLLTSTTGVSSAGDNGTVQVVEGRIKKANETGELGKTKIKLEVGDDASTPAGSLTAARDLVQNKGVTAVMSWSNFTYGSYRYLADQHVPVIGSSHDGPEWGTVDNMFAIEGAIDAKYPAPTIWGMMLKSQGVTKLALVGYGSSPSSTANVKNWEASAKAAGIDVVYENLSIPFGSTDLGSIALAVKNSGADGLYPSIVANSSLALLAALHQQGVQLKAAVLPTGYGQSLIDNETARTTSQDADFYGGVQPVASGSPATKQWQADLQRYAGFTGVPDINVMGGWLVADAMIAGLQKVQGKATRQSVEQAMSKVTNWNPYGLMARPRDFGAQQTVALGTFGNCGYLSKLKDHTFVPLNDGQAFCGELIPNSNANP